MIGLSAYKPCAQDAPLAPAAGCSKRGDTVCPRGRTVRAGSALHAHSASENLFWLHSVVFDLVVAADDKVRVSCWRGAELQTVSDKAVVCSRVEDDVADAQSPGVCWFKGEKVAVVQEGRHACPACGEADASAIGQEFAGKERE